MRSLLAGLGAGLLLLLVTACSTTKCIPDDDQLFIGLTKIDFQNDKSELYAEHAENTMAEVEAALATAPNGALFGSSYYRTPFPYSLWVWNACSNSHGQFKKWMNKAFGKPPVLMSNVNPALRASVAQSVLRKNGYMHGTVNYHEVPQKNPKKMKIGYTVHFDSLMTVDTLNYVNFPPMMQQLIDSTHTDAVIRTGSPFSAGNLDAERSRVSMLFRDNGYYYYQPGYASFLADTFDVRNRAVMRLQMADSLPREALHPWYIGNTKINLRRTAREAYTDSLQRRTTTIYYSGKRVPLRPRVILRDLRLRSGQPYSYSRYQESVQKLNATGIFSNVGIQFTPRDNDTLDLQLNCTFDKPYDFYVETNFVHRTVGRLGPQLLTGIVRRNAFRGGEKLDVNVHGSYEWQVRNGRNSTNTYQYGADASIEFPRIIAPFVNRQTSATRATETNGVRRRRFYATPWTIAKISADIIYRPDYYKMHVNSGEWTYRWQTSPNSRHEFSPLTVKYQYMNSSTERLDSVQMEHPFLLATLQDHFTPKMRYTYTYSSPATKRNPIRWETTIEESGNLVALYDVVVQGRKWNEKEKTLFKNPYSQFVRIATDLTKTWSMGIHSQLVGHANVGLTFTYGNSVEVPFTETFYVGGANSVRAFPVRTVGPGSLPVIANSRYSKQMFNLLCNGEYKLDLNLEYRARLFGHLNGAVFLDAGNVWLSHEDDIFKEEDFDVKFKFKNLFRQLATGTGVGLRYDLDFLVVRIDWGIGLHLPYDTGKSGYFNISRFRDMNTIHLAVGYPF